MKQSLTDQGQKLVAYLEKSKEVKDTYRMIGDTSISSLSIKEITDLKSSYKLLMVSVIDALTADDLLDITKLVDIINKK